nr:transglutaminase domain-containing protein [uncultured Psychroserpens sp.]
MKYLITISFTFLFICVHSQNYKLIDENVKNYPNFDQIDQLVLRVNNTFNTDEAKVRAYYTWISDNIAYDLNTYYAIRPPEFYVTFNSERINESITVQKRIKLAKRVFKERKALCMGFSALFKELCSRSQIEVSIIEGITKVSVNDIENSHYIKNHAWNAVYINNQWKLIDLTFSNGYENSSTGKWVKEFNDFYFFTNPEKLLSTHLPSETEFQLVETPLSIESFFRQPVFYSKYFESGLEISELQNGLINVSNEDQKIRLFFKDKRQRATIYYKFNDETYLKELQFTKYGLDNFVATLKRKSKKAEVLSLYYQNEKILDFKIEQ